MLLRKEKGGTGIAHCGALYVWATDGAVTEVPDELGVALLGIRDGGYSVAVPADSPVTPPAEVTEPAPVPDGLVTEPAPSASVRRRKQVTENPGS